MASLDAAPHTEGIATGGDGGCAMAIWTVLRKPAHKNISNFFLINPQLFYGATVVGAGGGTWIGGTKLPFPPVLNFANLIVFRTSLV